ncbi:MAG TPA: tRNA pseudouridine(55) synthase TruB, partial [Clostridia bacterium]|nr:tRNA pseudouridine(55) synthase TruB [Clostridia bacterium]
MMLGIVNLLKPPGITSNHTLVQFRRATGEKHSGFAGTLDPEAAGVLPVLVGKAARLADFLPDYKEYIAEITFGFITDTQDCEGRVLARSGVFPSESQLKEVLCGFIGELAQIPPAYSAIKRGGVPSYKLARRGEIVTPEPRKVKIFKLEYLDRTGEQSYLIKIACSKGTYIRTLCTQIGQRLG